MLIQRSTPFYIKLYWIGIVNTVDIFFLNGGNMKIAFMNIAFLSIAIGIIHSTALAQQPNPSQKHLMREDSAAVNALVMYPDTIRVDIFEACEYPSAIVSIATLQKNSSDEFVELISGYSKTEQENFWNMSRYPGFISRLAQEGKRSIDNIIAILKDYPADIRVVAMEYGTKYYDVLLKMDDLQTRTNSQFELILSDYPAVTQEALRELVQFPEIINLLNDHIGLTVRVGDRYRRNPEAVIRRADSLNLAATRQNAEDSEEWKQSIEQNPDEADDLKTAGDNYATESGYTEEEVNTEPDPDLVENYKCVPYNYWFGYPTWYPYSYWYPYPFWFDCGFYFNRHGTIVIIGSPSRYFTNWYFYYPEHWHRYPNLCNSYINHYYGRRRMSGGNSSIVHNWVRERKGYLPKDFIANKPKRTEVIRQLAQLDIDVQVLAGGRRVTPNERNQYLEKNVSRYPSLDAEQIPKVEEKQRGSRENLDPPEKRPAVRIMRPADVLDSDRRDVTARPPHRSDDGQSSANQPPVKIVRPTRESDSDVKETPRPSYKPVSQPPIKEPLRIERPAQETVPNQRQPAPHDYNFNKIQNAQEYQRQIWEQTQPVVRPQPQPAQRPETQQSRPAPRPQIQQPAKPAPVDKTNRSKDQ